MHDELSAAEARLRGVRTREENACVVNDHGMVSSVEGLMKVFHSGVGGCMRPRSFEYWG